MNPMIRVVCALPFLLAYANLSTAGGIDVLYKWKYIDYLWDSDSQKEKAVSAGKYDHEKIIPNDVQQIAGNRVLVTTPKYFDNPASLSTISSKSGKGGPLLAPYPDWSWHTADDCSGITSVSRVAVDSCNRLWVVDSGKIGNEKVCPAKILAFDAETDELLQCITIPDEISHSPTDPSKGRIEVQKVETVGEGCAKTWVYMGDIEGYGLLIWNGTNVWRLNGDVFAPADSASLFTIAGTNVTLHVGVSSVVIPPSGFIKEDYLLWKPMSAVKSYAASRDQLHESYAGTDVQYYITEMTIPSQELARDFSSTGVLFAGFPTQTALACWNLQYPLEMEYVVILDVDEEALQFISGVKITEGTQSGVTGENLWVMTNRLQKFITGTMDFDDTNFRVLGGNVPQLVNGTLCQTGQHNVTDTIESKAFEKYDESSS